MDGDAPITSDHSNEYVVVARRYRPQVFGDLIGQGMVAQALKNAISTERVGHAYLFTGARGVGKTSTARILAKALNCKNGPTTDPCGACDVCLQIANGDDVDVLEIDGASNRGIDEIRQLRSNVGIRPSRSRFKVYIIDEVHMLTKEAFNALLKTLEEPPEHVKFIFCTTEPGKIPITVLSRCQRFDFSPVDTADIARRLAHIVENENATADPEALELLARRAAGSMRDSQSLLEQLLSFVGNQISVDDVHSMFGTAKADRVTALLERLIARDPAGVLAELQSTLNQGVDAGQLAEQLVTCLRDVMASAVGCDPNLLLFHSPSDFEQLRDMGQQWGIETLLAALQILDQAVTRMRQSMHGRVLLEVALVRIASLEDLDELSQVVAQVAAGKPLNLDVSAKKKRPQPTPSRKPVVGNSKVDKDTISGVQVTTDQVDERPSRPPSIAPTPSVTAQAQKNKHQADEPRPTTSTTSTTNKDAEQRSDVLVAQRDVVEDLSQDSDKTNSVDSTPKTLSAPSGSQAELGSEDDTAPSISQIDLTRDTTKQVWNAALGQLGDMTADFAAHATDVAISAPNRLVVRFLDRYNTSKAYCERPEKRLALERAIEKVTGKAVKLEFSVTREDRSHESPPRPSVSNQQLKRQIASHPMVELAVKLFEAQVVKAEPGRKS